MRMTELAEQFKNEDYLYWIKSALCLQYTKEGLIQFAIKKSEDLHTNVLGRCGNPSPSGICSSVRMDYRNGFIKCCGRCERYVNELRLLSTGNLNLMNSNISALPLHPWQMAKLLMNVGQDVSNIDAGQTDLAGILSFIDHYILARADITVVSRIKKVRSIRNRIMHPAEMEVTANDFSNNIVPALTGLLAERKVMENNLCAKEAVEKINEVAATSFHITKESEAQLLKTMFTDLRLELKTNISNLNTNLQNMEERQRSELETGLKEVDAALQTLNEKVHSDAELRAKLYTDLQKTEQNDLQLMMGLENCRQEIKEVSAKLNRIWSEDDAVVEYPTACSKCKSSIKIPAQEECENRDTVLTGCVNSENLSELWVCCIKLYPWIKAELGMKLTICIASDLLGQDNVDSVKDKKRCMAANELLYHVLKQRSLLLVSFLELLEFHCEPSDAFKKKLEDVWPTNKEMKGYACLNEDLFETSLYKNDVVDTDQNQRSITERPNRLQSIQRRRIQSFIQDIETINDLIDNLLSKCYFSLLDHEDVHNLLAQDNKQGAAECLTEKMANGSEDMIRECCKILNSRGQGHVSRILTSPDENPYETDEPIVVERHLYPHIINRLAQTGEYLVRSFRMKINNVVFRSIVFHLQPIAEKSWKLLADKCSEGQFTEILGIIFPSENVLRFFSNKKNRLRVTIFSMPHHKSNTEDDEMAVLKLELTTTDSICTQDTKTLETNPIKRNIDLFCEELEINHDLLSILKKKCVVQDDIEEKLKHIYSRKAAIRCLMKSISQPEIGYSVLKGYSKKHYPYLYQELEKTQKDEDARKLFQCEAWTVPKHKETFLTVGTSDQYDWVTENIKCCFKKDDTHKMVKTVYKTTGAEIPSTADTGEREPFKSIETAEEEMQTTPDKAGRKSLASGSKSLWTEDVRLEGESRHWIRERHQTNLNLSDVCFDVSIMVEDLKSELQQMNITIEQEICIPVAKQSRFLGKFDEWLSTRTWWIIEKLKSNIKQLQKQSLISSDLLKNILGLVTMVEDLKVKKQQIEMQLKNIITKLISENQRHEIRLALDQLSMSLTRFDSWSYLREERRRPFETSIGASYSRRLWNFGRTIGTQQQPFETNRPRNRMEQGYEANLDSLTFLYETETSLEILAIDMHRIEIEVNLMEHTGEHQNLKMSSFRKSVAEQPTTLMEEHRKEELVKDFQELHSQEYTNAVLEGKTAGIPAGLEENTKKFLEMLKLSDDLCRDYSTSHLMSIRKSITNLRIDLPFNGDDQTKSQRAVNVTIDDQLSKIDLSKIFDIKQMAALKLLEPVTKILTDFIATKFDVDQRKTPILFSYIKRCVHFCWMMNMHSDLVHIKFVQISDQKEFDTDMFKTFRTAGKHIAYIVWPPLYSSDGGKILVKGIAEGKD